MDNQQVPKADSKFQKIARANHKKWKIRLLSHGGQKADSGGGPYKKTPDYNRAKSAPPGFGGLLEGEESEGAEAFEAERRKRSAEIERQEQERMAQNQKLMAYRTQQAFGNVFKVARDEAPQELARSVEEIGAPDAGSNESPPLNNVPPVPANLAQKMIQRARSLVGKGAVYNNARYEGRDQGSHRDPKPDPAIVKPGDKITCDCTGFVAWSAGRSQKKESPWFNGITDYLKPVITPQPGDVAYRKKLQGAKYGHVGIVTSVSPPGATVQQINAGKADVTIIHCSSRKSSGGAVVEDQNAIKSGWAGTGAGKIPVKFFRSTPMLNTAYLTDQPQQQVAAANPATVGANKITLEESEQLDEIIRKKGKKYCLFSKKTNRNLGCYPSRVGAMKRERQVQYFKHLKEQIIKEEVKKALLEEKLFEQILGVGSFLSNILGQGQDQGSSSVSEEAPTRPIQQADVTPSADGKYPAEGNVQAISYQGKRAVKYPSGEIRIGGTLAWRNNNPGNIRSWQGWGGIGKAYGFAVFETFDKGYQALRDYINKYAFNNDKHTISSFMGEYCPTKQGGTWVRENPTYAQMIGSALGVPINTKTNTFKGNQRALEVFAQTVKKVEGYKEGQIVKENMTEAKKKGKDDRCVRIAKRKYKAWPSAYASGAVVKCRQGKIWKGVNEEIEELDEEKKLKYKLKKGIASALATMTAVIPPPDAIESAKGKKPSQVIKKHKEELEEEWSEKYKRSIDCKHPKGFSQKAHCQGRKKNEEVELEERKLGKPSSETNLGDWFKRKGAPGKKGGWVDCNTCRDGKCKPCGRQSGEKRSKYPRCRPTPSQCKGYKRRGSNLQKEE